MERGEDVSQQLVKGRAIPEGLVEAVMVAYITAQIESGENEWIPIEDLDPARHTNEPPA